MKNELLFIIKSWIAFAAPSTISACLLKIEEKERRRDELHICLSLRQ